MTYETYEQAQELQKEINYYEEIISLIKNATYYIDSDVTKNRRLSVYDVKCGHTLNAVFLYEDISKLLCDVLYKKQAEIQEKFDKL